ncbi:hypothetical protein N7478_008545 [Penicillium angulare]|uniref:uncharacterized protein n=1 Tax=Penicillium angulare TaxID=116970 RepID=UPI002540D82E|nr:uncharacterized protein N7478_008545 [Penicillium angulare]KAJ5273420.1 hypothetical protein N7478_008545 [Penicillium angulare]
MESSDSPFSDLDVYADWSGDPSDPVEVKIEVEIHCVPYLDKAILNARIPKNAVLSSSLQLAQPRKALAQPQDAIDSDETLVTPTNTASTRSTQAWSSSSVKHRPSFHPDSFTEISDQDSIIVPDSPTDDFHGATIVPGSFGPMRTPIKTRKRTLNVKKQTRPLDSEEKSPLADICHSRKRSAKTASLPDSVTDSDRPYGGYKHKVGVSASVLESGASSSGSGSTKSNRPSLIPRPVNIAHAQSHSLQTVTPISPISPMKIPVVKSTLKASEDGADDELKFGPLLKMEDTVLWSPTPNGVITDTDAKDQPKTSEQKPGQAVLSRPILPVTPTKNNRALAGSADTSDDVSSEASTGHLSTVVSCGTPCDIHRILDSYSASDDYWSAITDDVHPQGIRSGHLHKNIALQSTLPQLVYENETFGIFCPANVQPATYKASITFIIPMEKGTLRGWLNFVIPGLPRLRNNDTGYLYFWTPPGQGIEVRTTHFKRHTIIESCMMGQFPIFEKVVIPVRPCDGRFYGFLKDFKVTQSIRSDILVKKCQQNFFMRYHAVCSIDLIQRVFWAEKCGLTIYVYGGPDGEFSCHLPDPRDRDRFYAIHLDTATDSRVGISEIQIICSPSNLSMFAVTWDVPAPRENDSIWIPRIRSAVDTDGIIEDLQSRYFQAEEGRSYEVTNVSPTPNVEILVRPKSRPDAKAKGWTWKIIGVNCLRLFVVITLGRLVHRLYLEYYPDIVPVVTTAESVAALSVVSEIIELIDFIEIIPDELDTIDVTLLAADTGPVPAIPATHTPTSIPIRDRVDYFLGWRGPLAGL